MELRVIEVRFRIDITTRHRADLAYREYQAFGIFAHVTEFSMRIANVDGKRNFVRATSSLAPSGLSYSSFAGNSFAQLISNVFSLRGDA